MRHSQRYGTIPVGCSGGGNGSRGQERAASQIVARRAPGANSAIGHCQAGSVVRCATYHIGVGENGQKEYNHGRAWNCILPRR